ncbi:MAG: response regulator [Candidatus Methylacidiphilales bacterium]|nr:response regulator transcription factor [Candidatus Methylacidiphilales bacterium]
MASPTPKFRVVICEDQRLFRHLLGHYLLHHPDFIIIGEAADGRDALDMCLRLTPDLVLLDLQMPGMHGFDILRELKKQVPAPRVIIITTAADENTFNEAMRLDADGFIEKDVPIETIAHALHEVMEGRTFVSPTFAPQPLERETRSERSLTTREREVMVLLAANKTRAQVSEELKISLNTLLKHITRIKTKTGLSQPEQFQQYLLDYPE